MPAESLAPDELHVWRAGLDIGADAARRAVTVLSDDERARAVRFHFERDRNRYIAGRAQLRHLLARYVDMPAAELRFSYGENGKPRLAAGGPEFNLSHSGGLALYAISADTELGVDVELYKPEFAGERIPEHFFATDEVAALRALPEAEQPLAFLQCWTRKEAFIKARGDGLSLDLGSFSVTLGGGKRAELTRTAWSADEPNRWSLVDLSDPEGEFVAAVAAPRNGWQGLQLRLTHLDGD